MPFDVAEEEINLFDVSRMLRLTLLAQDMVEVILDVRRPEGMTLGWAEQLSI